MTSFYFGLFTFFLFAFIVSFSFYSSFYRFSLLFSNLNNFLSSIVSSNVGNFLILFLFIFLLIVNLSGNIPSNTIPTIFYSFTLTLSFLFWLPLMFCVFLSQPNEFLAHMLPYGSPVGLILFLPLVELFSQMIRPLTLIIRLSTNLSAGHIIMYMFSYFTLLSSLLSPFIYVVLMLLFVLELCISALQAYIFVSLISLYINETV